MPRTNHFASFLLGAGADSLAAHLEQAAAFLNGGGNLQALVNRVGERFLAVDIFACFEGFDHLGLVPVVGSRYGDDVDAIVGDDFLVVLVGFACPPVLSTALSMRPL